ncbi:hypothetical protein CHS0354_019491 [Potamilus streckersoni]|uniref:DUF659 domain-containing protein n=1 Tax=Potamilus streckersoni TaxID=2493646 RepID=A0AAE0SHC8_9BIVA|nr:hypothetical protein CHS0354_019491 [Potamilus streckersoni]
MSLSFRFASTKEKDADKAVARLFYASSIPFAIADSTYFKDAITAVPCTVHCLDLLLEDMRKLPCIDSVITDSKDTVKFITTHQDSQACFRTQSELDLLNPSETVATHFDYAATFEYR